MNAEERTKRAAEAKLVNRAPHDSSFDSHCVRHLDVTEGIAFCTINTHFFIVMSLSYLRLARKSLKKKAQTPAVAEAPLKIV